MFKYCLAILTSLLLATSFSVMSQPLEPKNISSLKLTHAIILKKEVTEPISISTQTLPTANFSYSIYTQPVQILNSHFSDTVSFEVSTFNNSFNLSETLFKKSVNFNWVKFNGPANFYHVVINGSGLFYYAIFEKKSTFYKLECGQICAFYSSLFAEAEFNKSRFLSDVSFSHANFKESALFVKSEFLGNVDMSNVEFAGNVSFDKSFFTKTLNLANSKFKGTISFKGTQLPDYINLSHIETAENTINLNEMAINLLANKIKINLLGTNVAKINLNYQYFQLYFPPETADNDTEKVYTDLLTKFKESGDKESYNKLYVEYRQYSNKINNHYISDILGKYWWNYSTNPEWVFYWILIMLLFFTTINSIFFVPLVTKYCEVPFLTHDTTDYPVKHNAIVRFVYYFPRALLLTLMMFIGAQFRLGIDSNSFKSTNFLINIYFIIIILSGIICMFFLLRYLLAQLS